MQLRQGHWALVGLLATLAAFGLDGCSATPTPNPTTASASTRPPAAISVPPLHQGINPVTEVHGGVNAVHLGRSTGGYVGVGDISLDRAANPPQWYLDKPALVMPNAQPAGSPFVLVLVERQANGSYIADLGAACVYQSRHHGEFRNAPSNKDALIKLARAQGADADCRAHP